MRIAQIAPLYESVPPARYWGTERVVAYLTEELVRQGHDVTLFASGDSRTIPSRRCRESFDKRFTAARMARDYVSIYKALAGSRETGDRVEVRQCR